MKIKVHDMNRGYSSEEASEGFERISDSQVPQRRRYKDEQLKDAGLLHDEALRKFENQDGDEPGVDLGGFLPRSNYSDRF